MRIINYNNYDYACRGNPLQNSKTNFEVFHPNLQKGMLNRLHTKGLFVNDAIFHREGHNSKDDAIFHREGHNSKDDVNYMKLSH